MPPLRGSECGSRRSIGKRVDLTCPVDQATIPWGGLARDGNPGAAHHAVARQPHSTPHPGPVAAPAAQVTTVPADLAGRAVHFAAVGSEAGVMADGDGIGHWPASNASSAEGITPVLIAVSAV